MRAAVGSGQAIRLVDGDYLSYLRHTGQKTSRPRGLGPSAYGRLPGTIPCTGIGSEYWPRRNTTVTSSPDVNSAATPSQNEALR
jgi:hypothetical protein